MRFACQLAVRPVTSFRHKVLPEDRMQDVAGKVEGEGPLQRRQAGEVLHGARLVEATEGRIRALDIVGVVLAVAQLHDRAGDVRLEGAKVVVEIGEGVRGHGVLPVCAAAAPVRLTAG
jgi:hypothetical protein